MSWKIQNVSYCFVRHTTLDLTVKILLYGIQIITVGINTHEEQESYSIGYNQLDAIRYLHRKFL